MKIKGMVITVVAISTGCTAVISTGMPIAIKYGNGYNPDTKNHNAIINAIYGKFFLKKDILCTLLTSHLIHLVPCLLIHEEQTILEQITQDLLPNLDPHISQLANPEDHA